MLKKISLVFLLSASILSCNQSDINPADAVDKSKSKVASKPRPFDSKAITGADSFTLVNTGCTSEPTLYNAASWYIPASDQYETYATNGVIAGSSHVIQIKRLPDVYPPNRYVSLGIIRLLDPYHSYVLRNIQLRVNNDGTITPGNYYSNAPDSFIISYGNSSVWNGTLTEWGSLYEQYSSHFTGTYWTDGGAYPSSAWFIKINSCSVSFEGCNRKININYEMYIKDNTGQFRQIFPSSFVGLAVL